MSKKDCFAYLGENVKNGCYGLKELYCRKKDNCPFYKTNISRRKIEEDIIIYNKGIKR